MESEEINYKKKQEYFLAQYLENGNQNILRKILNFTPGKKKIKPIDRTINTHKINTHCFKMNHCQSSDTLIFREICQKSNLRNYDIYIDPEYKNKQMKGNSKWASQKFNLIKINKAKRYRTPIFSKIEPSKSQIINGNSLIQSIVNDKRIS